MIPTDLPRPGMVRVECDAHGWMLAHIYVADSPYYALTGPDGSFSIGDVPPGSYTLVASQHFAGDTETPVTVKGGESTKVNIDLKKKQDPRTRIHPEDCDMNAHDSERHELERSLRSPGDLPDTSTTLTRRSFIR